MPCWAVCELAMHVAIITENPASVVVSRPPRLDEEHVDIAYNAALPPLGDSILAPLASATCQDLEPWSSVQDQGNYASQRERAVPSQQAATQVTPVKRRQCRTASSFCVDLHRAASHCAGAGPSACRVAASLTAPRGPSEGYTW